MIRHLFGSCDWRQNQNDIPKLMLYTKAEVKGKEIKMKINI